MAHAVLFPEAEKGGRGKKAANSLPSKGLSAARLSQARTVRTRPRGKMWLGSRGVFWDLVTRWHLGERLTRWERGKARQADKIR